MRGQRHHAPYIADERAMLVGWLEFHRATLALKCADVPADRLAERSVPPSNLSLLGLVRHMTDVERLWFRRRFAGEDAPPIYATANDRDAAFTRADGDDAGAAFAAWRAECDHARGLVASATTLDILSVEAARNGDLVSLRWIMVHMIEEYARHNGHADLLRERIDGVVGY